MKQVFLAFALFSLLLIVQATDEALKVKPASPEYDLEVAETHYNKYRGDYKQYNYRRYQQPQPVYISYAIVPVYVTNGGGSYYTRNKHHG